MHADLLTLLQPRLGPDASTWLEQARARRSAQGETAVKDLFPQLPRRVGREPLGGGHQSFGEAEVDLNAWRLCDAAAFCLLQRDTAPDALELDLFAHGDLEERAMVGRSLGLLPLRPATLDLLGEAQRTNTVAHFEAAACDSNLAVRALALPNFGVEGFNRLLLKLAFLDLPLPRVFGWAAGANPELSRMLQGLATEREAAGREVWRDTNRAIARAPTEGTVARLVGSLEHGDDGHRLAAAEGLGVLQRAELAPFLAERLPREQHPAVARAIETALAPNDPAAPR
ncbi:MAG: EboA domain-containing protein [Planctomycetota bacterium]